MVEERKQLHRMAKAKARLMEVTEEMIFTFAARFMNMRWAGEVNYNTDYEAHDTNYRMALIKTAKSLNHTPAICKKSYISEKVYEYIKNKEIKVKSPEKLYKKIIGSCYRN